MREARIQRTRAWLRYSSRDITGARDMMRPGTKSSPYQAAFWAQQAAEKAIKGALTYAGVRFEEIHRLNALAALLPADWETRKAANALAARSRYAVQTRYPDLDEPEPTAEDARTAITQAAAVQQAIRRDLGRLTVSPSNSARRSSPALSGHREPVGWNAMTTTATNGRVPPMRQSRRLALPPAAAHFRAFVHLRSVDLARDRDRSYTLTWTPALFEGGALLRLWGRTGGPERTRIDYYLDRAGAQAHIEAILRRRLRHGYRVVGWE